ncbi:MAG: integrase arm-type DNA-binding domain-containing protein [Pseudomonadota bacterium]
MGKLTAIGVRNAKPGRHADGDGLYLIVRDSGSRQWMLRVVVAQLDGGQGKRRDFGLGSASTIPLADARIKAAEWREIAKSGRDPSAVIRQREKDALAEEARKAVTFRLGTQRAYDTLSPAWKNDKHRAQWINTLEEYVFPHIGDRLVNDIGAPEIIDALSPIWLTKPETARRVKQRIETVLDFAHAREWRDRESPSKAILLGLPDQPKKTGHFAAVDYREASAVLKRIEEANSTVGRMALRFTIHTVARSGEVRSARWNEFDRDERVWTIPADRMKAGKAHVIPLTEAAMAILEEIYPLKREENSLVFPSTSGGTLSDMTMGKSQKIAAPGTTVHGWRSTFRDWVAEQTMFAGELAEMALAHTIGNKVEAAYRRGNLLEKRRILMDAWSDYLAAKSEEVVDLSSERRRRLK